MIIEPKIRGFICTTAHPHGCAQHVQEQIDAVKQRGEIKNGPKKVLIIGSSTGYGLASRIAVAFGAHAQTIGVFFEKESQKGRPASAGWYNSAAFERAAKQANLYAKSLNGDAFSDEMKQKTIERIQQDWQGEVDLVIYSLASPKRLDPNTQTVYQSVLKPIGEAFHSKTIDVMSGQIKDIQLEPANDSEIEATTKVMGGEDWERWIEALLNANVLAQGAQTVAYSYIGPELTYPIYWQGTIGRAKAHLFETTKELNRKLAAIDGKAYISVNKAIVTQASAAIPVVPLYISLLYKVMKEKNNHEGCIEQMIRFFHEKFYSQAGVQTDEQGQIRLDDWEMQPHVQEQIMQRWADLNSENVAQMTDLAGYRRDFHKLFGFEVDHVDYQKEVEPEVMIPSLLSTIK